MQILVVDDEKVCLLAFVEELQRQLPQAQIDSYRSGEEAWKAVQETHYDMVFTDITMNGMSGVELATRIHEKDPDIPIYFETGETPGFLDRWLMKKKQPGVQLLSAFWR